MEACVSPFFLIIHQQTPAFHQKLMNTESPGFLPTLSLFTHEKDQTDIGQLDWNPCISNFLYKGDDLSPI